jgi:hypothetical protein
MLTVPSRAKEGWIFMVSATRRSARKKKLPNLRVKREPPTLEEAMAAAAGMADGVDQQVELAAMLLGIDLDESTDKALRAARPRAARIEPTFVEATAGRGKPARAVVVERKRGHRLAPRPVAAAAASRSSQ